ncbi:MAG TPA: transglycosylase SLT domain-containing protein [Casimicrobiaceae bacterium]|nr:transglycosylase SLT domain-containing protein [Casimicrobiaceae bacterium]
MPTKLLCGWPGLVGRQQSDPKRQAHRVATLVAVLAAILLSASTERLVASAGSTLAVPRVAERAPEQSPVPARSLRPTEAGHVDALVAAVAHRYRVSAEATREMVDTAYVEAGRNGLDPLLVIAVIAVESRFNPIAKSDGGAVGLMQVIPRYHGDKFDAAAGESMLDPRVNIQVGAAVLREYIRRGGTEIAGLQLYNGALDDETSAYAHKVLAEKQRLKSMLRRGA